MERAELAVLHCGYAGGHGQRLNNYRQEIHRPARLLDLLAIYAKSHRLKRDDGRVLPWIDENLNPHTATGLPAPG